MTRNKKKQKTKKLAPSKKLRKGKNMTSVIAVRSQPPFLTVINASGKSLSKIKDPRFYYPGGANVLGMRVMEKDSLEVYVPRFNPLNDMEAIEIVRRMRERVINQFLESEYKVHDWFLYDTARERIITAKNFSQVFVIATADTSKSLIIEGNDMKNVYYLADELSVTDLQFSTAMFARTRLMHADPGQDWTLAGKALISFLVSKRYAKTGNFTSEHGPWEYVDYTFPDDAHPDINLKNLNTTRAMELASKLPVTSLVHPLLDPPSLPMSRIHSASDEGTSGKEVPVGGGKGFSLLALVEYGIDNFIREKGKNGGRFAVDIDCMHSTFKRIVIDANVGIVEITLSSTAREGYDELTAMLATDCISIADEESLRIIRENEDTVYEEVFSRGNHIPES